MDEPSYEDLREETAKELNKLFLELEDSGLSQGFIDMLAFHMKPYIETDWDKELKSYE